MSFIKYLKEKIIYIVLLLFTVITCEILLIPFNMHLLVKIYIGICPIILYLISFFIEYYRKNSYYKEVLQETGKSMIEKINCYKYLQEEYKEYIELWIHEIKIPISAGKLVIENNKTEITKSIDEELDKIENYVEQALFYARSKAPEKDYYIKKQELKEIVNTVVLKNKRYLLQNKIKLNIHNINEIVYTDSKWCVFIMNQIIQNSIKYQKNDEYKEIEIFSESQKDNVILYVRDNGIGIRKGDISRVFEKGFTGENGRKNGQKSTGIGLYLCKTLCDKLGLGIELNSQENIGTEVQIVFPKSSFLIKAIGK